jgi:cyclopropane-fatty-acyl-phospholipid synthase
MKTAIDLMEKGFIPDFMTRVGIRHLLAQRLRDKGRRCAEHGADLAQLLDALRHSPIALHTEQANEQHYELPPAFFRNIMGEHMKYSAGYWPAGVETLNEAETAMLALTCQRAGLEDGQTILELGCGWGSLTLWLAEHYPNACIKAVSNSRPQREYIEGESRQRGITNVQIITADMNAFSIDQCFDRIISVEMFEHMRNYQELMRRISSWLKPAGSLFVHIFSHRALAYPFEIEDEDDWMARYFFTGGLMPSADLLLHFQDDLVLEKRWQLNGYHYQRTCEAWLVNQDRHREEILAILRDVYGADQATRWFQRWRMFFMACAELFGYRSGAEWGVSHYLFRKPTA